MQETGERGMAVVQAALLNLALEDGFTIARVSTSRGGQYNGPCPFCAGTDRFRIQPAQGHYGWFACNQCGKCGSAVDYLMLKRGMSKGQALASVGWVPTDDRTPQEGVPAHVLNARPGWEAPPAQWQTTARAFVRHCQHLLWSEEGTHARAYLSRRGLRESTIQRARLGYHPRQAYGGPKEWGRSITLYQGIIIPWFFEGSIWRITIRNEQRADGEGRYRQLVGGSNGLYLADSLRVKRPVVMTEGEIDALSLAQECSDVVTVVATGTTQGSHTPRWVALLAQQERVLVAFDAEAKGDTAAVWWLERLENAQRLRPWWKDANQMLQDGADLRQWVTASLDPALPEQPPQEEIATVCSKCRAEVEYYSEQGVAYCGTHWQEYQQPNVHHLQQHEEKRPLLTCVRPETFVQEVSTLAKVYSKEPTCLAIDLETTGLDTQEEYVVSIAFGRPERVTVLDMRPYYTLSPQEQGQWKQALTTLLHLPSVTWIGHHLKFDWAFLATHFGVRLRKVYDTMLVEQVLQAGLSTAKVSVSLLETAKRYSIPVSKEQRAWFLKLHHRPTDWAAPFPGEQLVYMAQDIAVPSLITEHQRPLVAFHTLGQVIDLENDALPALAAMEVHGVLIDQGHWRHILQIKGAEQHALERELTAVLEPAWQLSRCRTQHAQMEQAVACQQILIEEAAPPKACEPFKLTSADHLKAALKEMGMEVPSTRAEALEPYAATSPLLAKFLRWKELHTFQSTFGETILAQVGREGRIHAHFAQVGALSGRIICSTPNLQQIPKKRAQGAEEEDVRQCFIAPAGASLLKADLSNIELRILAEVSHDTTMLRFFAEGKDLHAETAKLMFRLPPATNTKQHLHKGTPVREIAKTINFGLVYGMGAQGLADRTGVSMEEARGLMQTYFSTYTGVATWLRQAAQQAFQQGYAATQAGRKRCFSFAGLDKAQRGRMERSAKNHPIQGTSADILKRALALLYDALPEQVHIILVVHDEIVLECPDDLVDEAEQILKQAMVQACRDYLTVVHIPEPEVLRDTCWKKG
jgi:DNA polymerase-1